jgi:hypothetical protein
LDRRRNGWTSNWTGGEMGGRMIGETDEWNERENVKNYIAKPVNK